MCRNALHTYVMPPVLQASMLLAGCAAAVRQLCYVRGVEGCQGLPPCLGHCCRCSGLQAAAERAAVQGVLVCRYLQPQG